MGLLRGLAKCVAAAFLFAPMVCHAQTPRTPAPATVRALLVSDIHFDPFWDPAKAVELAAAPVARWNAILSAPDSPGREARFGALERGCGVKGADTSYPLLVSSIAAMRADAAGAVFVTLSGDLMAHKFDCKYHAIFPRASQSDYRMFAVKTIEFVQLELHEALPGAALFTALGNNDSDCGDYRIDGHSAFLSAAGAVIAADLGGTVADRARAQRSFEAGGYFNAPLPAPLRNARMIVLDDLFMSTKYESCTGTVETKPAAEQIAWLREQLVAARRAHQAVWVMSHIPPGVDPYSTARKMRNVCGGQPAEMFLTSGELVDTLAEFGDVIRLAIFAHTHMDELRLLVAPAGSESLMNQSVPVKMVSSISPVDGNNPSFTVARVNVQTASMTDYEVYAASNKTGIHTAWVKEYDFADTYRQPDFTSSSVATLIDGFRGDPDAETAPSRSYLRNYFVGDASVMLKPFWPEYVCALANRTAESYRGCVCEEKQWPR